MEELSAEMRDKLDAEAFRRLLAHLDDRKDVQNIDLMILADFCRNCLGDWYREAAAGQGIEMSKATARARVYGMSYEDWKAHYQTEATPRQQAAFKARRRAADT